MCRIDLIFSRRLVLIQSRLHRLTFLTTSMPSTTDPNTQCLPSNQDVFAVHKKNCEPLVLGPALAIERIPEMQKLISIKYPILCEYINGGRKNEIILQLFEIFQKCRDCSKECTGTTIRSLEVLRTFEGCTKILGDLTIQISGSKFINPFLYF